MFLQDSLKLKKDLSNPDLTVTRIYHLTSKASTFVEGTYVPPSSICFYVLILFLVVVVALPSLGAILISSH